MLSSQGCKHCAKGNQLGALGYYGCFDFLRETKPIVNSPADGQPGCISVHNFFFWGGGGGEGGGLGYSESKTEPSEQRIAEIFNSKWDHNYCRISPREAQYSSRQGTLKKGQQ